MSGQSSTIAKSIMTDRNATYKASDVIEIFIPPEDVALLNPAETYLKFLVQMKSTTDGVPITALAQPDDAAGAHSLIREIQIYDSTMTLLEQLDTWNNWTSKYFHFNQSPGLRNIRTLMEGQSKVEGDSLKSQYWSGTPAEGGVYNLVECCLPFHMSGILGSTKVFPNILLGGIRLRITMSETAMALKAMVQHGFGVGVAVAGPVLEWVGPELPSFER